MTSKKKSLKKNNTLVVKNIDDLVGKAKEENLTQEEIDYVVQKIEEAKSNPDDKLYSYLYILGRGLYGNPIRPTYRRLMEYFLQYPQYPFVSKLALDILCHYWWFVNDYGDQLKKFIRGVEWDEYNEVKESAISNAGLYLKNKPDKELLSLLLGVFEQNDQEDSVRLIAYRALAKAQGVDKRDLYFSSTLFSRVASSGLIDFDIIKRAHEMVEAHK